MKVQGNRYINNPEMIKNKVEKKTTVNCPLCQGHFELV